MSAANADSGVVKVEKKALRRSLISSSRCIVHPESLYHVLTYSTRCHLLPLENSRLQKMHLSFSWNTPVKLLVFLMLVVSTVARSVKEVSRCVSASAEASAVSIDFSSRFFALASFGEVLRFLAHCLWNTLFLPVGPSSQLTVVCTLPYMSNPEKVSKCF